MQDCLGFDISRIENLFYLHIWSPLYTVMLNGLAKMICRGVADVYVPVR